MKPTDHDWQPSPELLAAYFDGELESATRVRVEAWLESRPDAAADLQQLMRETTPSEPSEATWTKALHEIALAASVTRNTSKRSRRPLLALRASAAIAASILVIVGLLFAARSLFPRGDAPIAHRGPEKVLPNDDVDVYPVAAASEITILRIEGADVERVVVGTMPVEGEVELASSGEICISCKCPKVRVRQDAPYRPMVWSVASAD